MISRRDLLRGLALAPLISGISISRGDDKIIYPKETDSNETHKFTKNTISRIIPPAIDRGDTVAITAPASPSSAAEVSGCISLMKTYGINCVVGKTVTSVNKNMQYLAGDDKMRSEELMKFIENDDIKGIICARGGYGVMRILNTLDYDVIRKHPKIIIGYSDITALLIAIYQKTGLVCFHGPVASSNYNQFTLDYFLPLFLKNFRKPVLTFKSPKMQAINGGISTGQLTGGNLTMVTSTLGTPYEIDTRNRILFLEETHEEPYKIDRLLMQLKLAGKFSDASGVIIGNFDNIFEKVCPLYTSPTMQVLKNVLGDSKCPVITGLPFGHMNDKITLPIGINATIDADKKIFSINEIAVA